MRVVHVAPIGFGEEGAFGGAERYVVELSRAMAEQVETTLLTFGRRNVTRQEGPLTVRILRNWVNFRRFRFDPVNPSVIRYLNDADVIHYHQPRTMMGSLSLAYARVASTPFFASDLGGAGLSLHRFRDVDDWYTGHLHISQFSRDRYGHALRENARVIYGGVDTDRYTPDPAVARSDEVLFVGRLLPHKGVDYLIEATDPDIPLLIVGRPWRHAHVYHQHLHELASGKRVRFEEGWDDAEVVGAYQRALCIVLPSVTRSSDGSHHPVAELLGQTLLEGMACGTPAICTDVCSLPEVVEDGVTGFVVPPNDAAALADRIRWLRANPDRGVEMGRAARERVLNRFTWPKVVERCLQAYASLSEARPISSA